MGAVIDNGNGFTIDTGRLAVLCRRFNVRRVELFGSATGPDFDPDRSDVDLLVDFGPRPNGMSALGQFFDFRDAVAEMLDRPVDVLEDEAVTNPYLRRAINAQRRMLFSAAA